MPTTQTELYAEGAGFFAKTGGQVANLRTRAANSPRTRVSLSPPELRPSRYRYGGC